MRPPPAGARSNKRCPPVFGGTLRRALSHTRGSTRPPPHRDGSCNSWLVPFLIRSSIRLLSAAFRLRFTVVGLFLIVPLFQSRLDLDHQPEVVVVFHRPVPATVRAIVDAGPDFCRIQIRRR